MKKFSRTWLIFGLWLMMVVAAFITADAIFFSLAYLLGAILFFSFAWAWLNIHWVRVSRLTKTSRSRVGEIIEEQFVVQNTGYLPKLWLELRDHSLLPGHRAGHVVSSLSRNRRNTRVVRTMCLRRGRFRLGPLTLISGDPFGLFVLQKMLPLTANLVVYPLTVPLPYFQPLLGEITGGEATHRRTHYVTTNVSGVRDYAPGDSFNRIHWPSTARTNRLIVKEFELDPMADVWVLLDMDRSVHVGLSYEELPALSAPEVPWESWQAPEIDPSTEEYAIVAAASIVQYMLRLDRTVGLVTYPKGSHCEMIQSDRGTRQEDRLLEVLAVTHPHGSVSLEQVLLAQGPRFNRNTTLMIITPSVRGEWVAAARHLTSRGVKVTGIVIDPGSFGMPYDVGSVVSVLAMGHIPHFVIHRGDQVGQALATLRHSKM